MHLCPIEASSAVTLATLPPLRDGAGSQGVVPGLGRCASVVLVLTVLPLDNSEVILTPGPTMERHIGY